MDFSFSGFEINEELNKLLAFLESRNIPFEMGENSLFFTVLKDTCEMDVILYHKAEKVKYARIILMKLKTSERRILYQKLLDQYHSHILQNHNNHVQPSDLRNSSMGLCNMVILVYFDSILPQEQKMMNSIMKKYDTRGIWNDITEILLFKEFV